MLGYVYGLFIWSTEQRQSNFGVMFYACAHPLPPWKVGNARPCPSRTGTASVCRMSHSPCGELLMTLISGQEAHVTNTLRLQPSQAGTTPFPSLSPLPSPLSPIPLPLPLFIPCTCNIATLEWKISGFLHMPHGNSCESGAPTALPVCCSYKPPLPPLHPPPPPLPLSHNSPLIGN